VCPRDSILRNLPYKIFTCFCCDRLVAREGGGVLLYVKTGLHAVKCSLSNKYPEQVWCYFLDARKVECYVGVCYRTPSMTSMAAQIMTCCTMFQ